MNASVLAPLTLGYRLLWNRRREIAGVELHVDATPAATGIDARHLLATLDELWPERAPQLLLAVHHPALLLDLLVHGHADSPWIALGPEALADPVLRPRAQQAQARGLPLLWSARPGTAPTADAPSTSARPNLYRLEPRQAVDLLPPGQILLTPESLAQAAAALDQRQAWAVAGWPVDSTLQTLGASARLPERNAISRVVRAIDKDASWDQLAALINGEPVLCYRFLQHVNAVAPRQRGEINSVQLGLQVWGLQHVQNWLMEQLPQADGDANLLPVRLGMAVRARLVEQLLDPGDEEELRREVYLCGLFAQLDRLLGEPLLTALNRLPLSQRILQSLLEDTGPYHPALQLAQALENGDTRGTQALSESYGYAPEDVNRALLRTLAGLGG